MTRTEKRQSLPDTDLALSLAMDWRDRPPTRNELAWIEFIRLASLDSDPAPTLARVQALRRLFSGRSFPVDEGPDREGR